MNKTKIVTFIESFIKRNLNFRYQPQLAAQLFCDEVISIANPQISADTQAFQLFIHESFGGQWNYLKYRFPQTRIYLHEFQNAGFRIQIIEFFSDNIIYLKNYSHQSKIKISLSHQPGLQIVGSESLFCQSDEKTEFRFETEAFLWLSGKEKKLRLNNIPAFLNETAISEKKMHPLTSTSSLNVQLMRDIDKLWAEMYCIGPQREIDVKSVLKTNPADLIWIQEIYLHFGWYQELAKVYHYLNTIFESVTENTTRKIIHFAHQRFCRISKLFGQDFKMHQFDLGEETLNASTETDFLNLYLYGGSGDIHNRLPDLWQASVFAQLPIFNLAFARDVSRDPENFIALTLLLFQEYFYRAPAVAEKLTDYLPENSVTIVKFLVAIKSITNLNFDQKKIKIGKYLTNSNLERHNYIENHLQFHHIRHGKLNFTQLKCKNGLFIKIDKTVNIAIKPEENHFEIEPVIYRPPVKKPDFFVIEIETRGSTVSLPLVWKKFILDFNGVRLKFLLKKSRYQISVKFSRDADRVRIEQTELSSAQGQFLKTYYQPEFMPDQTQIDLYDQYARRIRSFGPFIDRIYLRGVAVNGQGLLKEQFRVFRGSSEKSTGIATNRSIAEPFMVSQANLDLKLTADKTAGVELHREKENGLFHRLINTEASLLAHKLVIYADDSLKDRYKEIKLLCFETLAFIPTIKPLIDIDWNQSDFILIVANSTDFEIYREYPLFSIVRAAGSKKNKGILVRNDNLRTFFSRKSFMFNI